MISEITKYLILIGFVSVFEFANAADQPMKPIRFNSTGLNPEKHVKFYLYTSAYPDNPRQINIGDKNGLSRAGYKTSIPTKFVTHGWKEHMEAICVPPVRKGFLKHGFNVIVVDWKKIAALPDYPDAAGKVLGIAKYFAKMIDFLVEQGSDPSQITLAGHSLGAHISGLAAHNSKCRIGHVVAMDPAAPGFTQHGIEGRVHKDDADLVETIHTNTKKFGFPTPIQPIDYFPNGGKFQDGCKGIPNETKSNFCAHLRACLYYAESLTNPDKWYARKCEDNDKFENGECRNEPVVEFARWTNKIQRPRPDGTYYLRTNQKPTYGLGKDGV